MARAIDANKLEIFPYSEVAGTEEQIEDWIEQVGLSGDDTASRARNLCWKVIDGCINVVKTQPTLTQPNEPLTLEELREMDGDPVYVVPKDKPAHCGGWCGVTVWKCDRYSYVSLLRDADSGWGFEEYGKTWIAYRRPPEGEGEENDVIEITENL